MTLINTLLDLQTPNAITISPNSRQILYSTTLSSTLQPHRIGEHHVSTLWLADTGYSKSAHQITSGTFNDHAPSWHPSGKSMAFISDRAKAGSQWAIYQLPADGTGEPEALTPEANERSIAMFRFSPDGRTIAYLSANEKFAGVKAREEDKDDAMVWGKDLVFNRLRLVDVESMEATVLAAPDAHVVDLAWNGDGSHIAFLTVLDPDIESQFAHGTTLSTIDLSTKETKNIAHFPAHLKTLQWASDSLYALGFINPSATIGEYTVYTLSATHTNPAWSRHAYGETESPMMLNKAGSDVTIFLENDTADEIRMLDGPTIFSTQQWLQAWDAQFTSDSDEMIVAVAKGDVNTPGEVYSRTASGGGLVRLSTHGAGLEGRQFGRTEVVRCKSGDGTVEIGGLWKTPTSHLDDAATGAKPKKPLPTFVFPHGGPYGRDNDAFDNTYHMWGPLLLDVGFATLHTNYRGSSSRGEAFAAHPHGGAGTVEYDDVITLTNYMVEQGYADPERLVIGGWSQGGLLSYLACVRNGKHGHGWRFKGAIPGAGVTDFDCMTLTSDVGGTCQAAFLGKAPWQTGKQDVGGRRGSALWEFHTALKEGVVIPEVLILHGEKDVRVPLSQAVGFRRAMEGAGLPFEMAVYPREGHLFTERRHIVDMAERVLKFVEKCVGPGKG